MKYLTICLCVLIAGCDLDPKPEDYRVQRVILDGKPCIVVNFGFGKSRTTGLDCDWGNTNEVSTEPKRSTIYGE